MVGNLRTPEVALAQDQVARVQQQAGFILRLLAEVEGLAYEGCEEDWREQLSLFLWNALGRAGCLDLTIGEQLESVSQLDAPETIGQAMITALAASWDLPQLRVSRYIMIASSMPAIVLQQLAASPFWEVRYLVAFHPQTPWEARQQLRQDGNRYVRAMAQASGERVPPLA